MIAWWWLVAAAMVGAAAGWLLCALVVSERLDELEEHARSLDTRATAMGLEAE